MLNLTMGSETNINSISISNTISWWDFIQYTFILIYTLLGIIADMLLIYIIARNVEIRTKTNLILMNVAIINLCYLLANIYSQRAISALLISPIQASFSSCPIQLLGTTLETYEIIFVLVILSNTAMNSSKITVRMLLICVYSAIVITYVILNICCFMDLHVSSYVRNIGYYVLMRLVVVIMFKEIGNCYRKWYKKLPLDRDTTFRLNIGRIYVASLYFTYITWIVLEQVKFNEECNLILRQYLMTSVYILICASYTDRQFQKCFTNLFKKRYDGSNSNTVIDNVENKLK